MPPKILVFIIFDCPTAASPAAAERREGDITCFVIFISFHFASEIFVVFVKEFSLGRLALAPPLKWRNYLRGAAVIFLLPLNCRRAA